MNDATKTNRDKNGNIIPDLSSVWQPPAQATGLALATVVDVRPRRRGAAVTHG